MAAKSFYSHTTVRMGQSFILIGKQETGFCNLRLGVAHLKSHSIKVVVWELGSLLLQQYWIFQAQLHSKIQQPRPTQIQAQKAVFISREASL
nr:MAG TPA: hypothetical protein [Caudoviricetes sp.]